MSRKFALAGAVALALTVTPLAAGTASAATEQQAAVTTVYYSTSSAPSFRSVINAGAANWNSSVTNVRLVERNSGGASLRYTEGNDPRGSYASTNGHGSGTIFIDYTQARQYNPTRIAAHETGHALGLPDHYSGPCSELMSGGGPGPSCTNAYPNATERSRVNSLWANGLVATNQQRAVETIYGF
ncbi:snapalysin family zinc-dependent metalloprotease [Amycolatopsis sp. lyj-23]|uniref:snapalysin family zinc-dependent metalloprotease n=1 Tax=Amycolatopsis sp. lyj-23 TaxID=2789283 RepID=UPI00397947EB